jgi:hypothetical protein
VISLGLLAACGGDDAGGDPTQTRDPINEGSDSEQNDDTDELPLGDAARGKLLADELFCVSCHDPNYAGRSYYANITQDEDTGIGAWSDEEIARAIVQGIDDEGDALCSSMPRSDLSSSEAADLVAFLRTVAPVENEIVKTCPAR